MILEAKARLEPFFVKTNSHFAQPSDENRRGTMEEN
jgi:hypothetical protein